MIATLTALIGHKYGKIALEVLVVGGLVIGYGKWSEMRGRQSQKETDAGIQAVQIEAERKAAASAKDALLDQVRADREAADRRADAADQKINGLTAILRGLSVKSEAGRKQVSSVPDSELHGDVIRKLALRQPGEAPACYTPREERAIDDAVTQWPICQQEKGALASQVEAVTAKVQAREDTIAAMQRGVDAQAAYVETLEKGYRELWDAHPPRYRAAKCVWLWKCGKRKVSFALPKVGL